nr:hypothetical protein HK105_006279 [Polyrhizophydium stewartii]
MDGSGDDTLRRVLLGIPAMSPAISDPARHEKVLSFVAGLCSQAPAATVARLSGDLDALGVLCPAIPHPADDRITSLALRILGVLVAASAAGSPAGSGAPRVPVFQSLRKRYPPVLDHILLLGPDRGEAGDAESKSAIDLFGCLETLGMWLACDAAVAWMSDECERIRDLVLHAFETQNLFVVRSCCRLRLAEMADAGATADDKIAVLELAWLVAESAHPGAIELLVDCDLVMVCFDLLADMDRIVQHRAVDVLILLFSQQARHGTRLISQPAHTLLQSDFDFVVSSILVRRDNQSMPALSASLLWSAIQPLAEPGPKDDYSDPEAFVRRAAVSLVALLVGDPAAARRLIVDNNGVPAAITASSIGKCCFDDDLEVRVQAVRLLVALFGRADDVALAADPDEHPFFVVDGDRHFVSMLDDPSRLVRQQALEGVLALRSMHIDTALRDAKRERHAGSRADAFLSRLAAVDTEEMRMRCIPEHLYQEALDMDASVLNESNERGEGNNVLYCYDC